jgi:hypothetical protein
VRANVAALRLVLFGGQDLCFRRPRLVLSEAKVRALSAAFFGLVVDDGGVSVPAGSIFLKFGPW